MHERCVRIWLRSGLDGGTPGDRDATFGAQVDDDEVGDAEVVSCMACVRIPIAF
jgi:hypothetical protein